ncbi:MAG: hypothetical protein ACI9U2_002263 [Bradymonadia bacterium]|jgi:hypothetical protein
MARFMFATALVAALFACDDHDQMDSEDHAHGEGGAGGAAEQSPLEVGCQHFEFGIDNARATTADGAGMDSHIAAVHQRYVITFADVEGSNGLARFTASAAGMHYFMLGDDVPLSLSSAMGALTPMASVSGGTECAAAEIVHQYMLEAGDYTLTFGEAPNEQVVMVVHLDGQMHNHGGEHMAEGGHGGEHMAEGGHGGEHMAEGGHGGEHMAEGGHGGEGGGE